MVYNIMGLLYAIVCNSGDVRYIHMYIRSMMCNIMGVLCIMVCNVVDLLYTMLCNTVGMLCVTLNAYMHVHNMLVVH